MAQTRTDGKIKSALRRLAQNAAGARRCAKIVQSSPSLHAALSPPPPAPSRRQYLLTYLALNSQKRHTHSFTGVVQEAASGSSDFQIVRNDFFTMRDLSRPSFLGRFQYLLVWCAFIHSRTTLITCYAMHARGWHSRS